MKKLLLFLIFITGNIFNAKSQILIKNTNYDSLLVNTWMTDNVKINNKEIEISDIQKNSRVIFYKNHTSENKSNDLMEKGRWSIDAKNMTLKIINEMTPDEPVIFKIISLTASKFIFSIQNEYEGQTIIFTAVPAKI